MFNKRKMVALQKEINELKQDMDAKENLMSAIFMEDRFNYEISEIKEEIDQLKTELNLAKVTGEKAARELFELKYPNGKIEVENDSVGFTAISRGIYYKKDFDSKVLLRRTFDRPVRWAICNKTILIEYKNESFGYFGGNNLILRYEFNSDFTNVIERVNNSDIDIKVFDFERI